MCTYRRVSVAVAMTVVTLVMGAFIFVWQLGENVTAWNIVNYQCLLCALFFGAGGSWMALRQGGGPSVCAPTVASFMVLLMAITVLLMLAGVEIPEGAASSSQFPEPAGTILSWIVTALSAYIASMGFWLVKCDG